MRITNKIMKFIVELFSASFVLIIGIVIGLIAGLIFKSTAIGIFTFFGSFLSYVLFIWIRQIYWKITKTGDYEVKDKEE